STGAPLRDHELIHNYVLMGLSHAQQQSIESEFWEPIEANTGDAIGEFWRHYLITTIGLELDVSGDRSVYDAFRHLFPRLDHETLTTRAAEWRELSRVYRLLLDPEAEPDPDIRRQVTFVNTFGRASFPLVMTAYHEYSGGLLSKDALITELELVQSLLLRRTVV